MLGYFLMDDYIEQLRSQLRACRGSLPSISRSSGLSYSWLTKFYAGKMRNPTIGSLERLKRALDDRAA